MDTDFSCCLQSRDVELVWSVIKHSILTAMHKFIPKVKLRSHQRPKWFTPDIQHHLNCTRTLRRRHNTHPTPLTLQKLQHAEHILQEKMTVAKRTYEFNLVHTFALSNNSRIYKYIDSLSGNSAISPTVSLDSTLATSDYDKANPLQPVLSFSIYYQLTQLSPHSPLTNSSTHHS